MHTILILQNILIFLTCEKWNAGKKNAIKVRFLLQNTNTRRLNNHNSRILDCSKYDITTLTLRGMLARDVTDKQIRPCLHVNFQPVFANDTFDLYRPQRSCGQGNVFTGVCHSFCSQGGREGVCLSACWDTTIPPDQADTPRTRQAPPLDQADPPGTRQATPPGSRLQHTVYERPVRILLECILVLTYFNVICEQHHRNAFNPF